MKHLLNNLSEEEKNNIRGQHSGGMEVNTESFRKLMESKLGNVKPLLSEDNFQGGGTGAARDPKTGRKLPTGYHRTNVDVDIKQSYTFDKSKMKTGSDDVDVTNPEYRKLVNQLNLIMVNKKIRGPLSVVVTGGASSVGSSSGFNNQELAQRRAQKLINQLKTDVPNIDSKIKFTTKAVVGNATKLNSPEALAQQFVKVNFNFDEMSNVKQSIELDNTTVAPFVPGGDKVKGMVDVPNFGELRRVCVIIPESLLKEYQSLVYNFKKKNKLSSVSYKVSKF